MISVFVENPLYREIVKEISDIKGVVKSSMSPYGMVCFDVYGVV